MKQKSRAVLIVLSVILLLLIAGCKGKEDEKPKDFPFIGGTKGLETKFLKDEPPDEITDNNFFPFKVVLSIKNEGEFDLERTDQVRVDLKGFLPQDFNVIKDDVTNLNPENPPTSRKKDSEGDIIDAVEAFVTIPKDEGKDLLLGENKIKGNTEFLFRANVCYQYGTDAISKICILENMISPADDAICDPKGEKKVFSSSSPVQVTGFRQTVVGENKIQFSFDIEHVGKGKVFEDKLPKSDAGCPSDLAKIRREENKVKVTVKTGISDTLTCVSIGTNTDGEVSGNVQLVNGKRTITCTQEISSQNKIDLERNVDINLKFDYSDSIERKVLAKHLKDVTPGVAPPPTLGKDRCDQDTDPNTKCLTIRCSSSTFVPNTCSSTNVCTCPSGEFACAGACTPVTGDVTNPTIGTIEPEFAIVGRDPDTKKFTPLSQLFVIQDVFDAGGIKSCTLDNLDDTDIPSNMRRQGFGLCKLENFKCDFVGTIKFNNIGTSTVKAECKDFNENPREATANVEVRERISEPESQLPSGFQNDATGPIIGKLATNVAEVDIKSDFIVVGVRDPESGVKSCKFILPGAGKTPRQGETPKSGIDAEPLPFAPDRRGLIRNMIPQGPLPCLGNVGGDHGPCTWRIRHTFVSSGTKEDDIDEGESRGEGTITAVIFCTNFAGKSNTELDGEVKIDVRRS